MSFDIILSEIAGTCSPYQILVCIFMGILGKFYVAMLIFLNVFTAYEMDYKCKVDNRSTVAVDKCHQRSIDSNVTMPCTEWIFDRSIFESTIRSQYSLVCEKEWLVPLSSMMHMVGMFISSLLCGVISDKYGRLTLILITALVGGVSVILLSYMPHYWMYVLLRLLTGFASVGCFLGVNSYHIEITLARCRLEYITMAMAGFNIGSLVLVLIAYFERDYKMIQILVAPFAFANLLLPLFLCESPRWLLAKKGRKEAYAACQWIARVNGKTLSEEKFEEFCKLIEKEQIPEEKPIWDVLALPNLRRVSFAIWACYLAAGFVYYALNFGSSLIGGSIFVNFTIVVSMEFPGRIISYIGIKSQGRLKLLTCSYFGCSVCLFACAPLISSSEMGWFLFILYVFASLFIGIAFETVWLYSLEVYPTVARTSGVSVGQSLARIGAVLAPQVQNLTNVWPGLLFVISGSISLVATLSSWIVLPETGKMDTKDFLPEAEEFIERNRRALCTRNCLCCINPVPDEIDSNTDETKPFAY